MPTFKEAAFYVENGVTYYFRDTKAREQLKECYSPSNPPPVVPGVPSGGTTGQVLKKHSDTDYDMEWADESGGGPTNTWYATCGTSSGVGSKTATSATGDFVLATGAMVRVLFSNSNTAANPTISIDGSTAKNIRPVSGASGMDYMWKAGEVIDIVYDGSNFVMTKGGKADTSFYGITKLDSSTNSTATNVSATPKAVKDVKDMIPAASSATPQNLGAAAAGSSADYSRADHVHNKPTYTKGDVGLGNVDNVQQYSASNPPPYPVTSVNGLTGDVTVSGISILDVYPVGSIYMSVNSTDPGTLFGGTWEQIQDRFLLAAGTSYTAGATGGEATHKLTVTEMPSHTHYIYGGDADVPDWFGGSGNNYGIRQRAGRAYDYLQYVGGNGAHNNMPPYLVVYMWKRTA